MRSSHLHRWGVLYFLIVFAISWNLLHLYLSWKCRTYSTQDDVPWGLEWAKDTAENLQSEVWQIAIAVFFVDALSRTKFWFRAKEEE